MDTVKFKKICELHCQKLQHSYFTHNNQLYIYRSSTSILSAKLQFKIGLIHPNFNLNNRLIHIGFDISTNIVKVYLTASFEFNSFAISYTVDDPELKLELFKIIYSRLYASVHLYARNEFMRTKKYRVYIDRKIECEMIKLLNS